MAQRTLKERPTDVRMASVVKAFVLCLLVGGAAVGYVLQSHENAVLGIELEELERRRAHLERERLRLQDVLDRLQPMLEQMVVHHGLELTRVRPDQVVELEVEPVSPELDGSDLVSGRQHLAGGGRR